MAFSTKYRIEGTSDIYGKVTVNIRQDFYSGSVTTFEGAGRTWVNLSIGQGGNDISQAILPSFCSVQFYVDQDFEVLELAQDPPFTWQVQVLDDSSNIIWQGVLLPEEYQEDYTNTPYIVSITASDGLEELKSIEYPITVGGKASLWEHLTTALSYTGQSIPFFESVNIYDVEMDDDPADSPFLQAEVTYESFLKLTEKPNCYDVIVAILKPFYSRIYQYRGWRIENIYGKKTSYVERHYDASGVYVSQVTVNPVVELDNDPSDFKAFLGKSGRLDFHPALNSTSVYFNTAQVVNPDGPGGWSLNSDWVDDNTLTDWTTENGLTISKLPFGYNGSETILRIQGKQDTLSTDKHIKSGVYTIDSADFQNFTFRFDYWMNYPTLVIFGTKPILYLQVELTDSLSNKWYFKNGNWTLIKADGWIRIDAPGRQVWRSFENNINSLPNITGSADVRFYVYQLVKTGSADQVEVRLTNWATNIQVEELYTDLILEEKAGQNILSTYKGPSFQHFISDGEVVNLAGVMDVNGVLTSEWNRRGETDELNIRRLFMMQWLTMHQSQASKLSGSLYQKGEKVTPMSVLKDKDAVSTRKYVMTGWEFNLGNGIGSIKYHEIFEDEVTPFYLVDFITSIPPSAYLVPDYSIPIGVPGLSPGVSPGGSGFNIPNFTFPALNGDVRGEPSGAELTPSAIFGKARLDTTGLVADDIIFNAVKDTPDQENMTNLRLVDTYPIIDETFVPYTGAKANVNLGERGITSGYVKFDTTPTGTPTDQGTAYWDFDDNTIAVIMNGAIQKVGEDSFYPVKNQTGSNIAKGVAVRFAGTLGASGRLLIAPFIANGSVASSYFMGVTMEPINNGDDGKVMWFGRIRGINTNAYNEGDILYASTTSAGGFQTTVPQAPNNIVEIAAVINKSSTNGVIFVRPTLGSNINRDEGVKITSPTTGDLLQLQAGGLWENKSLASIIDSSYVPSTRTLTINGTSFDLSANRTWTIPTHDAVTIGTANGLSLSGQILSLSLASGSANGALSSTDWTTFNAKQPQLNGTGFVKASGTTITYDNSTYYLASNPSGFTSNVGTVTSVGLSSSTSGVTIGSTPVTSSGTITLSIATASGSQNGLLSSTDWTTFNNKQNALTNPVTGTGTTNYLPKFTGSTTIGDSTVFESGGNVGIGTNSPSILFSIQNKSGFDNDGRAFWGSSISGVNGGTLTWDTNRAIILSNTTSTVLDFGIGSTSPSMRLNTTGNLLIGTTTDNGARLRVNGGYINQIGGGVDTFLGYDGTGSLIGTSTNHYFRIITNNTERLRITSDGNAISSAPMVAWDVTTPGLGVGSIHIGAASSTSNAGGAITFGARDNSSGSNAQAGIYVNTDGSYGTRMRFATTDAYVSGSKVRMTINEFGNVLIGTTTDLGGTLKLQVAGNVALRASTTSSVPTQIPVFTADPSSTTRELVTRTPTQFRNDIGAGFRVSNGIYIANGAYVAHTGTGGTSYFPLSILPYTYYNVRPAASGDFHTWSIKGEVSFTSAYPVFVFVTGVDDSNSVNFSGVSSGDYRYEIDVCTVTASNTRLKVTLTVKLFNDINVWQRITTFDRTIANVATTPLDAMVNCLFSSSNAGNLINVYDLRVVENPYTLSDNSING